MIRDRFHIDVNAVYQEIVDAVEIQE